MVLPERGKLASQMIIADSIAVGPGGAPARLIEPWSWEDAPGRCLRSRRAPRGEPAACLCRAAQQEPGGPGESREALGGLAQQAADTDGRAAHTQVGRELDQRVLQLLSRLRKPGVQSFDLLFPGA